MTYYKRLIEKKINTALKSMGALVIAGPKFCGKTTTVKELPIYADYLNGEVRHYRDNNGLECDSVIHLENGDYALIETKLGGERLIEQGIKNLRSLKNKLENDYKHLPSFMAIVTATGPAYTKEGVHITPINLLGI